jgi:hypothetical protein
MTVVITILAILQVFNILVMVGMSKKITYLEGEQTEFKQIFELIIPSLKYLIKKDSKTAGTVFNVVGEA